MILNNSGRFMKTIKLASRNVFRDWRRTLVTTIAMGFACFIMILFASLMAGMLKASERNVVSMNLGEFQIHAFGYRDDPDLYNMIKDDISLLSTLKNAGFDAAQRLYGFGLAAAGSASAGVQFRGVNLDNEKSVTEIHNHMMQGSWLSLSDPMGVVLGRKLAKTLGLNLNDEVVIIGQAADGSMANDLFKVRGILKSIGDGVDRAGFFMIENTFRELMVLPEGSHEIVIMRSEESMELGPATEKISFLSPEYETRNWRQLNPAISRILELADTQTIVMILIVYTAMAMVVLNAMLMSVFERIREFGIMKAIGVTPWQIIRLVYTETFVQAVLAAVFAAVLGWSAGNYFQINGIDLTSMSEGTSFGGVAMDPVWRAYITTETLVLPIVSLFIISALAVVYPAVKAAVIQPVKAIYHR